MYIFDSKLTSKTMKRLFNKRASILFFVMVSILIIIISVDFTSNLQSGKSTLPKDIDDLVYSVGNRHSNTVIINAQGGPIPKLETQFFKSVFSFVDLKKYYLINVHQAQTINPRDFNKREMTFEEAKTAASDSTKMLVDVINHFKNEGKTVYVVGLSYGAFIVTDSIATYGNIADGYLIMVGRLDIPDAVWAAFSQGQTVGFVDGAEVKPVSPEVAGIGGEDRLVQSNMAKLAAGLGYKRFTNLLEGAKLSNVIYVYSYLDEQVGRLTSSEINFLLEKGATVIGLPTDHVGALNKFLSTAFLLLIESS